MNDEFNNETMLNILISQKKYLEAFRVYNELLNNGTLQDASKYESLIREVEQIDPVLTMSRETKEKKAQRLEKILVNIRKLKSRPRILEKGQDFVSKPVPKVDIAVSTVNNVTNNVAETPLKPQTPIKPFKASDIFKTIEEITVSSVSSIIDMIGGNFSHTRLKNSTIQNRIQMLQEMLRRIEIIKTRRKKEFINV